VAVTVVAGSALPLAQFALRFQSPGYVSLMIMSPDEFHTLIAEKLVTYGETVAGMD
jgi:TctA family transporter